MIGFFLPLIPLPVVGGSALVAGILGTLGSIGGMSIAEFFVSWAGAKPGRRLEEQL